MLIPEDGRLGAGRRGMWVGRWAGRHGRYRSDVRGRGCGHGTHAVTGDTDMKHFRQIKAHQSTAMWYNIHIYTLL